MKRISTGLTVLAIALVPLAGCGGDDDSEPTAAASTPAAAESTPAPPKSGARDDGDKPAASTTDVKMIDNAFEAKDITIKVGDTVVWENAGQIAHTATATAGADFDSGSVAPGESYEWTAKKAGTVSYVCTFHPGMEGTITVE
jgi:plastocyanin